MSSSIRRMAYSQDFKLRVLEYYFKHGGESKFGLKSKTAQHFGMDKKTISRMLLNPDMVKKASKMLAQRHPDSSSNLRSISKTSTGAKIAPKPRPKLSSDSQSIDPGDSNYGEHISPLHSKPFENAVPVFELPEDPDFSLLKRAISSSAGGAASVARLIATGTEEVQKIILNECDLIYECKVCKNLFRSVVNILAHKRIYCQEEFKNVKSLFSKENSLRMTSESETIMVDPEPPPSSPPVVDLNKNETQIDKIASRLADRNLKKRKFEELSSSTDTGSSEFYERLLNVHRTRSQMSKHCSVYLKDISGNSSAVYQTFIPPDDDAPEKSIHELLKEMHEKKLGTTALMDSQGQIVDSRVGEPSFVDISNLNLDNPESTENASQGSCDVLSVNSAPSEGSLDAGQSEDVERYVYTCPICSITFLSVSGCVKHLAKVHRKKKHQRERLRHVIRSRAYKKSYTPEEIKAHHNRNEVKIPDPIKSEPKPRERERKRTLEKKPEIKIETTTTTRPTEPEIPKSRENANKNLLHCCMKCGRGFLTPGALGSHFKYCQLTPVSPRPVPEMPEKKIAIQIRKDYKKTESVLIPSVEKRINSPTSLPKSAQSSVQNTTSKIASQDEGSKIASQNEGSEIASQNEGSKIASQNEGLLSTIDVSPAFQNEIFDKLNKICIEKKLLCVPCKRRFNKRSVLLKHASQHLQWTRFVCSGCGFKNFHRYNVENHFVSCRKFGPKDRYLLVREDHLGEFSYTLSPPSPEKSNKKSLLKSLKNEEGRTKELNPDSAVSETGMGSIVTRSDLANGKLSKSSGSLGCLDAKIKLEEEEELSTQNDSDENWTQEFNSDDDRPRSRGDRPHRVRRSVERKDFVYDIKRSTNGIKTEDEAPTRSSVLAKKGNSSSSSSSALPRKAPPATESSDSLCNGSDCPTPDDIVFEDTTIRRSSEISKISSNSSPSSPQISNPKNDKRPTTKS